MAENDLRSSIIVSVPEVATIVDPWRERSCTDKPSAGVPPHITLLFPFVPAAEIDEELIADLMRLAAGFSAFTFELRELRRFPATLYLAPEPSRSFAALTEALVARYPGYPPYGGAFETVVPHLTVVDGDLSLMDDARAAVQPSLPIACHCLEALLLEELQPHSSRWATCARLALAAPVQF